MKGSIWRNFLLYIVLFLLTFFTTSLAGAELLTGRSWFGFGQLSESELLVFHEWTKGLSYALAFLLFISFHEFGHYFTARYHRVSSSLPFYIPVYIPGILNIGSLGAIIRLREIPDRARKFFDIGISGPLAGFVIALVLLIYGFSHLPDKLSYISSIQPDYVAEFGGKVPTDAEMRTYIEAQWENPDDPDLVPVYVHVGTNLLFECLKYLIPSDPSQVPNHFDLIHYPFLFVGYLGLFFTALNLLPIGQLDGGHIIYGMFGRRKAKIIAQYSIWVLLGLGGTGLCTWPGTDPGAWLFLGLYILLLFYTIPKLLKENSGRPQHILIILFFFGVQCLMKWVFPAWQPNLIWLLYALLVMRFVGLAHPGAMLEAPLDRRRMALGYLAIVIFILSFTPIPIEGVGG